MNLITLGAALGAGLLTVLSPCVLPILPIVFGAAANRSRLGPLALAAGLAASFTAAGLLLATVGFSLGLDGTLFHRVAGVLALAVGIVLLVPRLQAGLEAGLGPFSRWASGRVAGIGTAGIGTSGAAGQAGLGLVLGAVWSPCVGPTLGAASVLASQGKDLLAVTATMAVFGLGAAAPLLLVGSASRVAIQRWRGGLAAIGHWGKPLFGAFMLAAGALALTGADRTIEALLIQASPEWLTRLTTTL
jgi:cytochrome c biogenesis protein CcdA